MRLFQKETLEEQIRGGNLDKCKQNINQNNTNDTIANVHMPLFNVISCGCETFTKEMLGLNYWNPFTFDVRNTEEENIHTIKIVVAREINVNKYNDKWGAVIRYCY
ncbi:hypothetical protein OAT16_05410 [Prolixibacteraceae bacterium]|nr:hypothetical protein [Prolixibacteraceae bacterium]